MSIKGSLEPENSHPPDLRPPGRDNLPDSSPNPNTKTLLLLTGMVILIAVTGAVLFILPRLLEDTVEPPAESVELNRTEITTTPPPTDITSNKKPDSSVARTAATRKLETLLTLKAQAESGNIAAWAEQAYQEILDIERRGDQFFTAQDYLQAENYYNRAVTDLKTLLDSKTLAFQEFLENGYQFLSEEKGGDALKSFNMALAIHPDDQDALAGAQRARNLDALLALYRSALAHERSGEFPAAENALKELQQLDNSYPPAQTLLDSVQKTIEKQEFEQQMGSFFKELEKGELKRARETLEKIKKKQSGHPEVIQAETLLITKEERVLVTNLRQRAQSQSSKEQWKEALATYYQILEIAPDVLFAVNGRDLAGKRVELDQALQERLSQPHRLQEDAQIEAAKRLLDYARQFFPGGARLTSQIDRLDKLVIFASTPVPVIINSDNMTDIVIYHVGRMGTFFSKEITLKPGKYTIVGSRKGFRDIRTIIEVDSEKSKNQLLVECREPI